MLFNELLDRLLKVRGAASRLSAAVNLSRQQIANVRSGVRKPDIERIEDWADALNLLRNSSERDEFIRLAYLAHAPDEVRKIVENQAAMITRLTQRIEALEKKRG